MKQVFKNKRLFALIACGWVLLVAYNNCAGQKFTFSPTEPFNPVDIQDIDCKSVVALTLPADGSPLHIPARDNNDTCYSLKLMSAVPNSPSSNNSVHDSDLLTENHDVGGIQYHNPYLMGEKVANLFLEGPRAIMLSGSSDGLSQIKVDNFILVGIMKTVQLYQAEFYKAYGTKDCGVVEANPPYNDPNSTYIKFKYDSEPYLPVLLEKFAAGGTASVEPFRVDGPMQTNREYSIDFRAVDCGGVAEASDIYLTFE